MNNLCIVDSSENDKTINGSMSSIHHHNHHFHLRELKDSSVNIEDYEDFNDMDNCAGLLNFDADQIQHSVNKENNYNESLSLLNNNNDKDVEMKSENVAKRVAVLRENNNDENILSRVIEEKEDEDNLDNKYTLFKKEKPKKKKKNKDKNTSSDNISIGDDLTLYNKNDFPEIESMDEDKLKEQCKMYGLKPSTNKAMKKQLKEIYIYLSTKQLPDNLKKNLTDFLNEDEDNNTNDKSSVLKGKGKGNISINSKSSLGILNEQKKKQIVDIIKEERDLWERILLFQKIELKNIKAVLAKAKIIVGNDILKDFLTDLGVVFSGGWNNNDNNKKI